MTIAPGAAVEARVDVSQVYEMTSPGNYQLTFRDELMDVATEQAEVPHPLDAFQAMPVECPSVEVTRTGS